MAAGRVHREQQLSGSSVVERVHSDWWAGLDGRELWVMWGSIVQQAPRTSHGVVWVRPCWVPGKDYSNPCTRQKEESVSHCQLLIQAHWEPVLHLCAVTSFPKGQGKIQAVTSSSFTKGRKRESAHHPCSQFLSGHIHREDHALRDK